MAEVIQPFKVEVEAELSFLQPPRQADEGLRQFVGGLQQGVQLPAAFPHDVVGGGEAFQFGQYDGFGLFQEFGRAVQPFDHAFEGNQRFEQHHQIGGQRQAVAAHDLGDVVDDLADA